jgi:positive regulator of sigma E activity
LKDTLIFVFVKSWKEKNKGIYFVCNRLCLKQDLSTQQQQLYFKKLTQITDIPDKFKLTEEQLVQIAIEENILIGDSMYLYCVHILLFQITTIYLMSCILC